MSFAKKCLLSLSLLASSSSFASTDYAWPQFEGRYIAADLTSIRTLTKDQQSARAAEMFCAKWAPLAWSNWGSIFFNWDQRRNLWQLHEFYDNGLQANWAPTEGGYMLSSVTCQ